MKNPPDFVEVIPQTGHWVLRDDELVSQWAKQHGTVACDPALFQFLRPLLSAPGMNVIWDIGAFIGDHTRFYLDLGRIVYAVEPNPLAYACLSHNCPTARTINAAASSREGTVAFSQFSNAGASRIASDGAIMVPAVALDDQAMEPPNYVKIDVEGWEYEALLGMEITLRQHKPLLFIEMNQSALAGNGKTPEDVMTLLRGFGYSGFEIVPSHAKWDDPQYDVLITP